MICKLSRHTDDYDAHVYLVQDRKERSNRNKERLIASFFIYFFNVIRFCESFSDFHFTLLAFVP